MQRMRASRSVQSRIGSPRRLARTGASERYITMTLALRILTLALCVLWTCCTSATQPLHNYSDKTVAELLELLENKDSTVRQCAASYLGDRYRDPEAVVIRGLIRKPYCPSPELPIPLLVVARFAEHLKTDPDLSVRICAVRALRDLRFRTNTTPILVAGLNDKEVLIRVRTCTALIDISKDYSEPLAECVIPTLAQCLRPGGRVGDSPSPEKLDTVPGV